MPARPLDPSASPLGALLPDFSVRTRAGRTIHRRDFKGRRHLLIAFAAADDPVSLPALFTALIDSWRAERADLLLIPGPLSGGVSTDLAGHIVGEGGAYLRERFGVGVEAALFIADRYGEIVYYRVAAGLADLPVDQVHPTLEQLEMRCSL